MVQDQGQEENQSGSSSRVSSAKSLVSSMFSGSEEEEEEYDAYARARKINLYGQVRPVWPLLGHQLNCYNIPDRISRYFLSLHDRVLGHRTEQLFQ